MLIGVLVPNDKGGIGLRRVLFQPKSSKFGSMVSLFVIALLSAVFSIAFSGFLVSPVGRIFAAAWALTAIIVFTAHLNRMVPDKRNKMNQYLNMPGKDVRTVRQTGRYMRG